MTLDIRDLVVPGAEPVSISVPAGAWRHVVHPDPERLLSAVAGLERAGGGVAVDGRALEAFRPARRARLGLATSTGRLPAMPGLRVVDLLLLGRALDPQNPWRAAAGSRRARARLADGEAWARALAGRLGIAGWVDEPATDLPPDVAALAEVGRAAGSRARALVWRSPDWLGPVEARAVEAALRTEQSIAGWPLLEVRAAAGVKPTRGPVIVEIPG